METVNKASSFAHESVDKIADLSNQTIDAIEEHSQQLKDTEHRVIKNCQLYVRDNPVTSLGIAIASGFILSRLLSSR